MAAPPLISLRDARLGFGGAPLFRSLEMQLGRGERACLVGRNGSGKTTLMRVIAGEIELDEGERFIQPGLRVSILPQDPVMDPDAIVLDHVMAGGQPRHEAEAILAAVGLDGFRQISTLSGGEARRAAIARTFAGEPDVVLLDEPTNHLDLAAIEWLERCLRDFRGAVLTVSHDRTFLVNTTNRTFWLVRGTLRRNDRGFADFDAWSEQVLEAEQKELERLNSRIADEARWLLRGITARRRRNQGRLRKLEQMRARRAAFLRGRDDRMKLAAATGEVKSRLVIDAEHVSKAFPAPDGGKTVVVRDFSTRVLRGDRIGLIGANGSGKTTLLRLLTGDLVPDSGSVRLARAIEPAYFDQHRAALDPRRTPWQILCPQGGDSVMVQGRQRHVVAYLKDFLFTPGQAKEPVGALSGGERNRLMLATILAKPSDLLVLDEPTNDLDMDTLDLLQELLADYAGTLLLVSHDRDFLDRTVSSTIALESGGEVSEYPGGYRDYLAQRPQAELRPAKSETVARREAGAREPSSAKPRRKLGYKQQRELETLPGRIEALAVEARRLEAQLDDPAFYRADPTGYEDAARAQERTRAEQAAAESRWLALEEQREALEDNAS